MGKGKVVVVGSGLGGLECAYLLSCSGYEVTVLEQGNQIGGCLQSYTRFGRVLDTGMHYVGGLEWGQTTRKLFDFFCLMGLPWTQLDTNDTERVVIAGDRYDLPQYYGGYVLYLKDIFPHEAEGIDKYVSLLREVAEHITDQLNPRTANEVYTKSLFAQSAYDYLTSIFHDQRIIDVLSGPSMKMELRKSTLPLYVFAQINSQSVQSAWRLRGGGQQIPDRLQWGIEQHGGRVLTGRRVTSFEGADGQARAVLVNGGAERYEADYFISDAHPAVTARLLAEGGLVRKVYKTRMTSQPNTFGMFTVSLLLKPARVLYQPFNIFIYQDNDVWQLQEPCGTEARAVMVSYVPPTDRTSFSTVVDILAPMRWEDVSKWFGTKVGKRGDEYEQMKSDYAARCIELAATQVPGLKASIEKVVTSTPLTYADYTGTECGSAYGIRKDWQNPMFTVLTPRTPVANVLMTGQSLNLHGVMGVTMTTLFTCAELMGMENVRKLVKI